MARIELEGIGIEYELIGPAGAPAVAITPGGRFSKDARGIPELGRALADRGLRVLSWDRPNCGASDLYFEGASESSMQGSLLVKLVRALELGPTALIGGSAGARVSLFAARQDPGAVARLVLWWISGGRLGLMRLGSYYCCEPAEEASLRGMAAVAQMPIWTEQLARNPKNREIMVRQDRDAFVAQMERWAAGYVPSPDTPIAGITKDDFTRISMPVMILRGSPRDLYHPAHVCDRIHALLPDSRLVDPPWAIDVFAERMVDGKGLFSDWPLLAPRIADFTRQ